jgi:hypothetical protein
VGRFFLCLWGAVLSPTTNWKSKAKATNDTKDTRDASDEEWLPPEKQCNQKTCRADANYTWRKNKCGLKTGSFFLKSSLNAVWKVFAP